MTTRRPNIDTALPARHSCTAPEPLEGALGSVVLCGALWLPCREKVDGRLIAATRLLRAFADRSLSDLATSRCRWSRPTPVQSPWRI
jgi:hypothetical protein